jgi:SPP1 family predicted phage head-tail adaptor
MQLDRIVTIQTPTRTTNASGQYVTVWSDLYASIHGHILSDNASTDEVAMQYNEVTSARWVVRDLENITHECRLLWRGQVYQINGVTPYRFKKTDRPRYLLLNTTAQAPDQHE